MAGLRNSGRRRESSPTSGAPAPVRGQGRGVGPGHGGPGLGGPGHIPDLDQGDLEGDLDLEDLTPGWTARLLWRRLKLLLEADIIKFCGEHSLDIQPSSCIKCKLVTRSMGRDVLPELLRLRKAKDSASDSIPSAAERYASRLDERPPTLTFTETDLALAVSVFNRGRM